MIIIDKFKSMDMLDKAVLITLLCICSMFVVIMAINASGPQGMLVNIYEQEDIDYEIEYANNIPYAYVMFEADRDGAFVVEELNSYYTYEKGFNIIMIHTFHPLLPPSSPTPPLSHILPPLTLSFYSLYTEKYY